MAKTTENIILEHLRKIRADMGGLRDDVRDVKARLTSLETTTAGLRRDYAEMYGDVVGQHGRYDALVRRIEKIEKRLEIAD